MSYRGPLVSAVAFCAFLLAGALALWACGLYFPTWLLEDEHEVLDAPVFWLREALAPLASRKPPEHTAVVTEGAPHHQTAEAEARDLQEALRAAGISGERREALLSGYGQVRQALVTYGDAMARWREESFWARDPPPRPELAEVSLPEGFPGEIEDYLRGAVAYHRGDLPTARAAWRKLLDRPEAERRHRATWAAFMLGRAAVESDPEDAVRWLRKTRELVSQGFPDPLGLAEASLGWEARAEIRRGRPETALPLYLEQERAGDPTALESIRRACGKALADPDRLLQVARSDEARPIMTSYVLSGVEDVQTQAWLAAVQSAGVSRMEEAEQLAWAAYQGGSFDLAARWLERAPQDTPLARWTRAKLLLRQGDFAAAEPLLVQAVRELPLPSEAEDGELWRIIMSEAVPPSRLHALGELGAVRLQRREYTAALDALLRSGYWDDAAYVAERVLTLEELRVYVKAQWPPAPAGEKEPDWTPFLAGLQPPPPPWISANLRSLLGRRLARAGRYREAVAYLPAEVRGAAREIADGLAVGRSHRLSAPKRAEGLFTAACLTRHHGLEILGTELEPDWAGESGSFDLGSYFERRTDPEHHKILTATADERKRVRRSQIRPAKRFHYRYLGADLAWQAAALLPDGSEEKARMLAVAGSWIQNRDPEAADRFYKRLVRCCANTELGQEADALRWFPEVEDCAP